MFNHGSICYKALANAFQFFTLKWVLRVTQECGFWKGADFNHPKKRTQVVAFFYMYNGIFGLF